MPLRHGELSGMAYDWGTDWPGVFERHADTCPVADGGECTCGPLGYNASIPDPESGARIFSPMLATPAEARAWRREQEAALDAHQAATRPRATGSGRRPRVALAAVEDDMPEPEPDPQPQPARRPTRRPAPQPQPERHAPPEHHGLSVTSLIDTFLDAAEDGEARGASGRPYTDDELAELEWALAGYVEGNFHDLDAGAVRGRHVFRLIDELEDAGMPRSRLRSVVGALREMFEYAADRDLVRVNPAAYVSLPEDDRRPRVRLPETIEARIPRVSRSSREGAPAHFGSNAPSPLGGNLVSEDVIWMCVKIVTLVFVCIALVLAAESI